jgi:hypothetical protein
VKSSNSIWFASLRFVYRSQEGWVSIIYFCSIELFWVGGFDAMFMREKLCGGW